MVLKGAGKVDGEGIAARLNSAEAGEALGGALDVALGAAPGAALEAASSASLGAASLGASLEAGGAALEGAEGALDDAAGELFGMEIWESMEEKGLIGST